MTEFQPAAEAASTAQHRAEPTTVGATLSKSARTRALLGLGGGMTIEWYDFAIYGLMAAFIGPHFFPSDDPIAPTLSALIVFAIGFGARPLSALIFGPFADTLGHKRVLLISITLMSIGTLVIGIMPTYETLGIGAGIVLVICRLIQGMSAGIEVPVATAASMELAAPGAQGRFAGFVMGSFSQFGVLLSSLIAFLSSLILGADVMADWGWRVPFIIGGILGLIVLVLRRSLPETGAEHNAENATEQVSVGSVWRSVRSHWLSLLAIVFVVGGTQVGNYIWTAGLPNLAQSAYGEDPTAVFAIVTLLSVILTVMGPIIGTIADRTKGSTVFFWTRLLLIPTFFLTLLYASQNIAVFAGVVLGGGVIVALNQTLFPFIIATLMPALSRSTGIAIGYGFGVALFGGTAPYLLLWFQQQGLSGAFQCYAAGLAALSILFYFLAKKKNGLYIGR